MSVEQASLYILTLSSSSHAVFSLDVTPLKDTLGTLPEEIWNACVHSSPYCTAGHMHYTAGNAWEEAIASTLECLCFRNEHRCAVPISDIEVRARNEVSSLLLLV